jgi:hypothetical protein
MTQDLPVVARYRMPVPGRSARGSRVGADMEEVAVAVSLRGVPEGSMEPLDARGGGYGRKYHAFEGRAWIPLCPRAPGSIIRWSQPATLDEAVGILGRGGYELGAHGMQPSPFSPFLLGVRPLTIAAGFPGGGDALREPVAHRVREIFASDVVHDGRHVYLASRAPTIVLRRGRTGGWTFRTGPATPFDPKNDEVTFCVRQAERFAKGLRELDRGVATDALREARRIAKGFADLEPDGSDLDEMANSASVGALWLSVRFRQAPDPATSAGADFAARLLSVRRRAALGAFGSVPAVERPAAIEDAVRLVGDLVGANPRAEVTPEARAFLSYAECVALPRLVEASPVPDEDIADLGGLAP